MAALAVAAVVRVAWLADKPFWRDEAWVAALAREAGLHFELSPRPVPAGFLFLTAVALRLPLLPPEVALRLLPLFAGLATVALLPLLVRELQGRPGADGAAAWIAAGMPVLIYYSRELKPYALDGLLAVAVPWLAWRAFAEGQPERPPRERVAFAAVLAAAPWTTFGSTFPIGAALAWAGFRAWRSPHARRAFAGLALLYALSFLAAYTVVVRDQSTFPRLLQSWQPDMAWLHEKPWPVPLVRAASLYAQVALGTTFPVVWPAAAALCALGAFSWPSPGRSFLVLAGGRRRRARRNGRIDGTLSRGRRTLPRVRGADVDRARGRRAGGPRRRRVATARSRQAGLGGRGRRRIALVWSFQALAWRVRPYHNDLGRYFRYDILHDVDPLIGEAARPARRRTP